METPGRLVAFFIFILTAFSACKTSNTSKVEEELTALKTEFIQDKRTRLFEYEVEGETLKGYTDQVQIKSALGSIIEKHHLTDSLLLVPLHGVGKDSLAYISVSVANIRSEPKHSSELATQALMGTPVRVLYKTGSWFRIQTPDKYLGYIESGVLSFENTQKEKLVYTEANGFIYDNPNLNSSSVSDLVLGNILSKVGQSGKFIQVELPDGRSGFVPDQELVSFEEFIDSGDQLSILQASSEFLGVPYLWGGTSFKGVDCSGFTKNVMLQKGIYLPRDASQQALVGDEIDEGKSFENLKEGDLLFFGRAKDRVTHVGVYLGERRFIHSSGMVKFASFDPDSPEYDEFNTNRFLFAKRVIESKNVSLLNPITFY
ncbi:C40 family peptidase [Jiulongibacter sp. NS-SX5]|uniref:C40 family peptidase n=1 Tax=Jiulongibacter sp. NS-SX5 TaxID=3463854 RepID=UPI004058FB15